MKFEYRKTNKTKVIVRKRKRYGLTNGLTDGITDKAIAIYPYLSGGYNYDLIMVKNTVSSLIKGKYNCSIF
jgi:hypothetical protein